MCICKELSQDYEYDQDGKYEKKFQGGQITFQIIEQRRYSHIVLVAADKAHSRYKKHGKIKFELSEYGFCIWGAGIFIA